MRKFWIAGLLLLSGFTSVGCVVPIYNSSRDVRARQLIFNSENLRHIPEIWERIWFMDIPDPETPYRVHGGVI